ncbi:monovalent cation/H(+) antiporter subunit G [Geminocystis sp. NIES-3709]|uniref:monovalent cation/H(+) antiporter subunit G n=1 Tax=Geminocystis sp. NIES-3709 TaxID=1617448 RepID=UPI0005FCDA58|nr:monovalent cation/H(+) antiporter subunit G [Geminocystis sp. NIES-3709]BAQ65047.1 Na(+) H(+) antiporter subunit G [Geminocystis sp. NIES-3709]
MINFLTYFCLILGLIFWVWGTVYLISKRSPLYKLHTLTVSDTLGSIAILVGLLWKIPTESPLLILGIIFLAIWNTMLGYVLAYSSSNRKNVNE